MKFVMCQEKTMDVLVSHDILKEPPFWDLQPNAGNDKCWVWSVGGYIGNRYALKFSDAKRAGEFKDVVHGAGSMLSSESTCMMEGTTAGSLALRLFFASAAVI